MYILFLALFPATGFAAEKVLYDFEDKNESCWEVPEWCFENKDYVCKTVEISDEVASHGKSSLKLAVDIPGLSWRAGVAECPAPVNLAPYNKISCDFYLPKGAPNKIQAKLIMTVKKDSEWKWIETAKAIDLIPGQWVTLTASLKPDSKDWISPVSGSSAETIEMTDNTKENVQKVAVRVESDQSTYKGGVFIDNIVVSD